MPVPWTNEMSSDHARRPSARSEIVVVPTLSLASWQVSVEVDVWCLPRVLRNPTFQTLFSNSKKRKYSTFVYTRDRIGYTAYSRVLDIQHSRIPSEFQEVKAKFGNHIRSLGIKVA
jgi:hypothetical protein